MSATTNVSVHLKCPECQFSIRVDRWLEYSPDPAEPYEFTEWPLHEVARVRRGLKFTRSFCPQNGTHYQRLVRPTPPEGTTND